MTKTEKALFELVRLGIDKQSETTYNFLNLTPANWHKIARLSKLYGIYAIIFDGIKKLPEGSYKLPVDFVTQFVTLSAGVELRTLKHWNELDQLVAFFSNHHVKVMLLKGMGMTLNYPRPNHRDGGDFDVYLMGDYAKGNQLMKQEGIDVNEELEKHSHFTFKGIDVENHQFFLDTDSLGDFKHAEKLLHQILKNEQPIEYQLSNGIVYFPSPTFNALFLLCHTSIHLLGGDTMLRQYTDIALFFEKYADKINHDLILDFLRGTRLFKLSSLVLSFCVDNMGLRRSVIPSEYYCDDKDLKQKMVTFMLYYPIERKGKVFHNLIGKIKHKSKCMMKRRDFFNAVFGGGYLRFYLPYTIINHLKRPHTISD